MAWASYQRPARTLKSVPSRNSSQVAVFVEVAVADEGDAKLSSFPRMVPGSYVVSEVPVPLMNDLFLSPTQ